MRLALILAALGGCAYAPPPSQVSAPGTISGDVWRRWSASVETGWVVPAALEWRRPRRDQLGCVVTWRRPF